MTDTRAAATRTPAEAVFALNRVTKRFGKTCALDDVSLRVTAGERLALVGESGSGKTTLLRLLMGLTPASSGSITYLGQPLSPKHPRTLSRLRSNTGVIFQDPGTSFNPFLPLHKSLTEPLLNGATDADIARMWQLLAAMQLPADAPERYPHEFSGGQRQRLAAVRALITEPDILLADEPVSSLDVLARSKFLTTLADTTRARRLTQITVTHDLTLVPQIADTVAVLKDGKLLEHGPVTQVFQDPAHPYTAQLLAASGL